MFKTIKTRMPFLLLVKTRAMLCCSKKHNPEIPEVKPARFISARTIGPCRLVGGVERKEWSHTITQGPRLEDGLPLECHHLLRQRFRDTTVLARVSHVSSAPISLAGFTHRVPNH